MKKAKPAKLFLACDGARDGNKNDIENIEKCKAIVEDIDWDCKVYKDYAETNMGCGMRPQTAIKNAFDHTEQLIVLEDDCVPHRDFFPYMAEMLERYKDDTRIGLISGFNHFWIGIAGITAISSQKSVLWRGHGQRGKESGTIMIMICPI